MCYKVQFRLFIITILFGLGLLVMITLATRAQVFPDDLIIDEGETVRLTDGTYQAQRGVLVNGTLILENCSLYINHWLTINENGSLLANNTMIEGYSYRGITIASFNNFTLTNSSVGNLGMNSLYRGIALRDGRAIITDSEIYNSSYSMMEVFTDITIENTVFTKANLRFIFLNNYRSGKEMNATIRNCTFNGLTAPPLYGVFAYTASVDFHMNFRLEESYFTNCSTAMIIQNGGGMNAVVQNCHMRNVYRGVSVTHKSGEVSLRHLTIEATPNTTTHGMVLYVEPDTIITTHDVTINNFRHGVHISSLVEGYGNITLHRFSITGTEFGVNASVSDTIRDNSGLKVVIEDSNLENNTVDFHAGHLAHIEIWNTSHTPGKASLAGTDPWVRGYARINPQGVRWNNGPNITEGSVDLYDNEKVYVCSLDIPNSMISNVLGWEMRPASTFIITFLVPWLEIDDRIYSGVDYYIWDLDKQWVTINDDFHPQVVITYPDHDSVFNESSITVFGDCIEEGAGLDLIEYSSNGDSYLPVTEYDDASWRIVIDHLDDGDHNISVRAVDLVGNVGDERHVSFTVDTTPPNLVIDPFPELTNEPTLYITGRSEYGGTLTVNDENVEIRVNGSFIIQTLLDEGENELVFKAEDRYGNMVTAYHAISLDTTPPAFIELSPDDGSWVNTSKVVVTGRLDGVGTVWIEDEPVDMDQDSFNVEMDLGEGDHGLHLVAKDSLGNMVEVLLVIHVDLSSPQITIVNPEPENLVTSTSLIHLQFTVYDEALSEVTVNGEEVSLVGNTFTREYRLDEGETIFNVEATDIAGNRATMLRTVQLDTTAPRYVVDLAISEGKFLEIEGQTVVTTGVLTMEIEAEEEVLLKFPNGTTIGPFETYHTDIHLIEGENLVEFEIEDKVANRGESYSKTIRLDSTPPHITIEQPSSNFRTSQALVIVKGTTEQGSTVTINGVAVSVMENGSFQMEVHLQKGENTLTVDAVDRCGYTNSTLINVVREEKKENEPGYSLFSGLVAIGTSLLIMAIHKRRLC